MAYQSINPFNGKTVKTFETVSDSQLETKLATATAAFVKWRKTSYAERTKIVACKIACNVDPLRGHFRVQYRPL